VEEIEKETTPGRYIEWTLAYRHDDKTYSSVSDGKMSKGGKGEGSSVFRRGRWMLRNGNDSLLRRDAERINELSCCAPEQKKKKKEKTATASKWKQMDPFLFSRNTRAGVLPVRKFY
jgi:hypothetical protein